MYKMNRLKTIYFNTYSLVGIIVFTIVMLLVGMNSDLRRKSRIFCLN